MKEYTIPNRFLELYERPWDTMNNPIHLFTLARQWLFFVSSISTAKDEEPMVKKLAALTAEPHHQSERDIIDFAQYLISLDDETIAAIYTSQEEETLSKEDVEKYTLAGFVLHKSALLHAIATDLTLEDRPISPEALKEFWARIAAL